MQEEVNDRTIALAVRTTKMTADVLRLSLMALLRSKHYKRIYSAKQSHNDQSHGRQSLRKLMKDGSQISNIEITDDNIRSFERVARKYNIAYSLKKDVSVDPPRFLVFFKAKDVDIMAAAFKEYTGLSLNKDQERLPVRQRLEKAVDRTINHRERVRSKVKNRGQER